MKTHPAPLPPNTRWRQCPICGTFAKEEDLCHYNGSEHCYLNEDEEDYYDPRY